MKLYQKLALLIEVRKRIGYPPIGVDDYESTMDKLPSGSGFDKGTEVLEFRKGKLFLRTHYHHMENGFYVGWTSHDITVVPDLIFGFTLKISGRNMNGIKDHIAEVFEDVLNEDV